MYKKTPPSIASQQMEALSRRCAGGVKWFIKSSLQLEMKRTNTFTPEK
ncbi:MAG: hypothetical protein NTX44_11715 [Ignavibacteriales bacterium]|nr:hypothetical protein [Ignavibacteriales bacterium]